MITLREYELGFTDGQGNKLSVTLWAENKEEAQRKFYRQIRETEAGQSLFVPSDWELSVRQPN